MPAHYLQLPPYLEVLVLLAAALPALSIFHRLTASTVPYHPQNHTLVASRGKSRKSRVR